MAVKKMTEKPVKNEAVLPARAEAARIFLNQSNHKFNPRKADILLAEDIGFIFI